jgi:hypothetical protein
MEILLKNGLNMFLVPTFYVIVKNSPTFIFMVKKTLIFFVIKNGLCRPFATRKADVAWCRPDF